MSIRPDVKYSQRNETDYRESVRLSLLNCRKKNESLILQSPDGASWEITVSNAGAITATAAS